MLCIQNIQTAYNPYQPFQHSLSSPLTVCLRQQCFSPNSPHFDAVDVFVVALMVAVQLVVAALVLLVGWLHLVVAVPYPLHLVVVGWLHLVVAASYPHPFVVQLVYPLQF